MKHVKIPPTPRAQAAAKNAVSELKEWLVATLGQDLQSKLPTKLIPLSPAEVKYERMLSPFKRKRVVAQTS